MTTYTLELHEVIDIQGGVLDRVNGSTILTGCSIGLDDYPIFDPAHRTVLNGLIIDYFINREIGFETIEMFTQRVRTHMNLHMPAYNELYRSQKVEFEILNTVDIRTEAESETEASVEASSESNSNTSTGSKARAVASTTPQTMLSGNEDYASSATDSVSSGTSTGLAQEDTSSVNTGSAETSTRTHGYQGVPSALIMQFRDSIINVDRMIIDSLEIMFMAVFNNGDTYTNNRRFFL